MDLEEKLAIFAEKISLPLSSNQGKHAEEERARCYKKHIMQLNFILLTQFIRLAQMRTCHKHHSFSRVGLKKLESAHSHLKKIMRQAHFFCSQQALYAVAYQQLLITNKLILKKMVEWKLFKTIKMKKQINCLKSQKSCSALSVKSDKHPPVEVSEEEAWQAYQHHTHGGTTEISPI